jgi:hypothetical protein
VNTVSGVITLSLPTQIPYAFGTGARVVPAIMYQVTAAGLTRNGMLLSAEVEDLQVEFGIDVNGDGWIDPNPLAGEVDIDGQGPPLWNPFGFDPSEILQVQLTVTTRTAQGDPDFVGQFPVAANRTFVQPADTFRRRRFIASIRPRNIGNP